MIEEQATVVQVAGDDAWVETQRKSSCSSCAANKGCGTSVLSNVLGRRANIVRVLNSVDASPGDEVIIGIEEQSLVRGSIAVYLIPLVFMFVLAILGEWFATRQNWENTEVTAIIGAILGFIFGLFWLRKFSRKIYSDQRYQPVILRKVNRQSIIDLKIISG